MKYLFLTALLILPLAGHTQSELLPLDHNTGEVSYLISIRDSLTKAELFLKSKDWATTVFENYKDVVQVDDKDLGKLRLKGAVPMLEFGYYIRYSITISCTHNFCSYNLTNITRHYRSGNVYAIEMDYSQHLENKRRLKEIEDGIISGNKEYVSSKVKKEYAVLKRVVPEWDTEFNKTNESLKAINDSFVLFLKK